MDPIDRWPNWKANSDGSMIFPPNEYGGHGNHLLELKYTYRMNLWISCEYIVNIKVDVPF